MVTVVQIVVYWIFPKLATILLTLIFHKAMGESCAILGYDNEREASSIMVSNVSWLLVL